MNRTAAQQLIARYCPCRHDNADTNLGNGKIWTKCEDCGVTFLQENRQAAHQAADRFEAALATLAAGDGSAAALEAYAKELGLRSLTADELIASLRRVADELNRTSRAEYKTALRKAYRQAYKRGQKEGFVSIARLRRMSLAKITELIAR